MWVTSRTGSARRILGILKKSVSWVEFCHGRRRLAFACSPKPGQCPCGGCHTCVCVCGGGADEKVIIERLSISLPYVETFNTKVIKRFVPELRSRYVFTVFRDSYVLCICVMNILYTFHMFMYGYGTIDKKGEYCPTCWHKEVMFTFARLSWKPTVVGSFMSQKTVSMTFFTDCCDMNFFHCRIDCMDCFFDTGS